MSTKIPKSVLEDLQAAGLSRAEAVSLAREKYAAIKGTLSPEDIEYLGTPLTLSVSPISGTVNDTFTFTVSGFNPKHTVVIKLDVRLGRDPELCTITDSTGSLRGGDIAAYGERGLLRKITGTVSSPMRYSAVVYAQEKIPLWIDKKSNRVVLQIAKSIPIVGGIGSVLPGMEYGITGADFMPAPPPYPPLPNFIIKSFTGMMKKMGGAK